MDRAPSVHRSRNSKCIIVAHREDLADMNPTRAYYRIMLGAKSAFAEQCIEEGWFGGGWGITQDLTNELPENWREPPRDCRRPIGLSYAAIGTSSSLAQ